MGQEQRHPAMVLETITETDMEALSARSRGVVCPEGHDQGEAVGAGPREKESNTEENLEESGRSKIVEWMENLDVAAYEPRVLITTNAPPPASSVNPSSTARYVHTYIHTYIHTYSAWFMLYHVP